MTLYEAAKSYLVCGTAQHQTGRSRKATREALKHVLWFYGQNKPLASMDNSTVLQYIKLFDPFDCDPVHEIRGAEYCNFIEWMMKNHLIPAWAEQLDAQKDWADVDEDAYQPRGHWSAC